MELPVVEIVTNSITLVTPAGVTPPAMTHLVLDVAFCFALDLTQSDTTFFHRGLVS